MKKALLACALFLAISISLKAQFNIHSIYNPTEKTDVKGYKSADAQRLLSDYNQLLAQQDALSAQLATKDSLNQQLSQEIKYRYIREQIELQKFQFVQNGAVLPDYNRLVSVSTDAAGKITGVTIISTETGYEGANHAWVHGFFTVNAAFSQGYPVTSQLIQSGFMQFQDVPFQPVAMMSIKHITFPYLVASGGSTAQKQKYNEQLLDVIKAADQSYEYAGLLTGYLALEKKEVPGGQLDAVIAFREKFIIQFKKIYDARH